MYKSFEDAEQNYYAFYYGPNPDTEKAIKIAKQCFEKYKEHRNQIIMDLIVFYGETSQVEKCKEMLRLGFEKNIWYPKEYFEKFWDKSIYADEINKWEELKNLSTKNSKVIYEIELPNKYDKKKSYPIFLSLHGWGEDLKLFKKFWKSDILKKDFIHVFVQSSQMLDSYHYTWLDQCKRISDIRQVVSSVKSKYNTSDYILVGGFSEGASASIDLTFNYRDLNISGFVSLNPSRPKNLSTENLSNCRDLGIRAAIITGDLDQCFKEQNDMMDDFRLNNIACRFHVSKNFGHWFPDDLPKLIDQSLEFISL